jgi:hypothetical protein
MVATKEPKVKKSKKIKSEKPRKPKLVKLYDTELDPLKEADGLLKQIETAESEAAERSLRVELCREELTDAKTAYKDAVAQLRKLCRARKERHPLFDQKQTDQKPASMEKEPPKDKDGLPEINYNQPATAVTIEMTEDYPDVAEATKGRRYHPWSVTRKGVEILIEGKEYFFPTSDFVFVTGRHLVDDALTEHEEGFNASQWQAWLRSRPEAKRPTIVVTDGSALKSHATNKAWQDLPLSSAGINGKIGTLLAEAGHDTLGRLSKLMQEHGQWWPKEVKGIGEAGATEVADLFAAFWSEHPEYCAA